MKPLTRNLTRIRRAADWSFGDKGI